MKMNIVANGGGEASRLPSTENCFFPLGALSKKKREGRGFATTAAGHIRTVFVVFFFFFFDSLVELFFLLLELFFLLDDLLEREEDFFLLLRWVGCRSGSARTKSL